MDVVLYSIPFFFLLIGVELVVSARSGRGLVRLNDSIADLSCGTLSQISGVFTKLVTIGIYAWVERHWALQRWVEGVPAWPEATPFVAAPVFPGFAVRLPELASWLAVFVLVDLAYYWSHRLAHEVNLLWAGHVVHHSSEEYNLPVALRQSSLHGLMSWIFYVPLALLGVPWQMYAAAYAWNLVYQFWIHTRAVGRLGRFTEWILNTPSHHRVHHGRNPQYLDRNYAGALIVWDRLFGTFQPEEEEPVYGITTPLRSWNPLWANVHVFWDIARDVRRAATWRDRWMHVFGPPGWDPEVEGGRPPVAEVDPETYQKWDTTVPPGLAAYGLVQFGVAVAASIALLLTAETMAPAAALAGALYVAVSLAGIGGVFEAARWAWPLESARLAVLGGVSLTLGIQGGLAPLAAALGVAFCAGSIAWLLPHRRHLTQTELAPIM